MPINPEDPTIFPTATCLPTLTPTLILTMQPTHNPTLLPTMTLTCKPFQDPTRKKAGAKKPAKPTKKPARPVKKKRK